MKPYILVGAGALAAALAACSKPAETAASADAAATPAAAVAPAQAPGEPRRKAGLWSITMSGDQAALQGRSFRTCIDEATDAKMDVWGREAQGEGDCTSKSVVRTADGWTFSAVCAGPSGGTVKTSGKATGDFSSNYKVEVNTEAEGSSVAALNGAHSMTLDAVWQGACPQGWKAGDVELAEGMRVNPQDMAKQAGDVAKAMQNMPPALREKMAREMAERMGAPTQ